LNIDSIIFLVLSGIYYLLLLAVYRGLGRLQNSAGYYYTQGNPLPSASVIVAARNEQERIGPCLSHLEKLVYPDERLQVILVDDNSRDETARLIGDYCARHANWKLIRLGGKKEQRSGKREALLHGIAAASGQILFTTDADCQVPPLWLKNMVQYFSPDVAMVLGHSPYPPGRGYGDRFMQFDNLFSAIVTAASAKLGFAFSSVGRNMAYRRTAYEQVGGYQAMKKFRSGDDLFLTQHFRTRSAGRIDFSADPHTFVVTRPPAAFHEIFNQQIRKNSKLLKGTPGTVLLIILIFIYYVSIVWLPLMDPSALNEWGILVILKLALEWICLLRAIRIFQQESLRPFLPFMQLVYPVFIVFFSLLGIFQKYNWKQ
jgi:cellulose synthase/poly-beta-1,6-N-acetylglucosamine synthase-like glycosyltransferase